MQGGMKCRIVSAFAPLPLAVRNVGVFAPISGAMWASPPTPPEETFRLSVGADAHVGPSVIGIVLPNPSLPTGKGFQNLGFGALLVTFPAREK